MDNTTVDTAATDGQGSDETPTEAPDTTTTEPEGSDGLGNAGKKALAAMKEREKAARAEARELKKRLADLEAAASAADKTPDEQALEAARREAEAAALAKANERILRSDIKAAAAGKLADPSDALAYLDLSEFEADESGNFDSSEIAEAISDLLERKPYLAAQGGRVSLDSGRGKAPAAGQLTRDDLKNMSPEEITAAKAAGRLNGLLGRG